MTIYRGTGAIVAGVGLTFDDGNFIVGDGSAWVTESGNVARTSLGLGTTDSPTFAGLTVSGNIAVAGTVDGRDVATDGTKLDGIESGATADQTAAEILTALLTVDGSGSTLDADTVDGQEATIFAYRANNLSDLASAATARSNLSVYSQTETNALVDDLSGVTDAATARSNLAVREMLAANRTYYVDGTLGSDSNDGLSSGAGAFATLQKAIDTTNEVDFGAYTITISVADGTYTAGGSISGPNKKIILTGNTTTPANCVLNVTSANALTIMNGAVVNLGGFKVQTTTSGNGIAVYPGATLYIDGNMDYGTCAGNHIDCQYGSTVYITSGYTISGDAVIHWHAGTSGANIELAGSVTVTLSGTPNFSSCFAGVASNGTVRCLTATFSGSATGTYYIVWKNGHIDVGANGLSYLPGNSVGVQFGGGTYSHSSTTHHTTLDTAFISTSLKGSDTNGPAILNEAASSTNPTLVPDKSDLDTGIGLNAANKGSLIAGGAEIANWSSTGIGIGIGSPDGTLHVHSASAGTVAANSAADDYIIENNGNVGLSLLHPDANGGYLVFGSPSNNAHTAIRGLYNSGAPLLDFFVSSLSTYALRLDATNGAGRTRMFVWDVDNAAFNRVEFGADDSGGSGYKMLRCAN